MPFGKVIVAIANKHARQIRAMPEKGTARKGDDEKGTEKGTEEVEKGTEEVKRKPI